VRVNVYAEEMTDRIEVIEKKTKDGTFTGLRFYLELPVTMPGAVVTPTEEGARLDVRGQGTVQVKGPFMHHPGDDDSAAVTFWGKQDLRAALRLALQKLDEHYAKAES